MPRHTTSRQEQQQPQLKKQRQRQQKRRNILMTGMMVVVVVVVIVPLVSNMYYIDGDGIYSQTDNDTHNSVSITKDWNGVRDILCPRIKTKTPSNAATGGEGGSLPGTMDYGGVVLRRLPNVEFVSKVLFELARNELMKLNLNLMMEDMGMGGTTTTTTTDTRRFGTGQQSPSSSSGIGSSESFYKSTSLKAVVCKIKQRTTKHDGHGHINSTTTTTTTTTSNDDDDEDEDDDDVVDDYGSSNSSSNSEEDIIEEDDKYLIYVRLFKCANNQISGLLRYDLVRKGGLFEWCDQYDDDIQFPKFLSDYFLETKKKNNNNNSSSRQPAQQQHQQQQSQYSNTNSIDNMCFVTAIRDPIERFLSGYNEIEYLWINNIEYYANSTFKQLVLEKCYHTINNVDGGGGGSGTTNINITTTTRTGTNASSSPWPFFYYDKPLGSQERFVSFVLDLLFNPNDIMSINLVYEHLYPMSSTISNHTHNVLQLQQQQQQGQQQLQMSYLPSIDTIHKTFPKFIIQACPPGFFRQSTKTSWSSSSSTMQKQQQQMQQQKVIRKTRIRGQHETSKDPLQTYQAAKSVIYSGNDGETDGDQNNHDEIYVRQRVLHGAVRTALCIILSTDYACFEELSIPSICQTIYSNNEIFIEPILKEYYKQHYNNNDSNNKGKSVSSDKNNTATTTIAITTKSTNINKRVISITVIILTFLVVIIINKRRARICTSSRTYKLE